MCAMGYANVMSRAAASQLMDLARMGFIIQSQGDKIIMVLPPQKAKEMLLANIDPGLRDTIIIEVTGEIKVTIDLNKLASKVLGSALPFGLPGR